MPVNAVSEAALFLEVDAGTAGNGLAILDLGTDFGSGEPVCLLAAWRVVEGPLPGL